MSNRALIRQGWLAPSSPWICCAAPLLAVSLPLAGLGAWLAGAGLVVLPLIVAGFALFAWAIHHRRQQLRDR